MYISLTRCFTTLTTLLIYQRNTPCHFFINQPIRWQFGDSFGKSTSHGIPMSWGLVQDGGVVKSNLSLFPEKSKKNINPQIFKPSFQGRPRKLRFASSCYMKLLQPHVFMYSENKECNFSRVEGF